MAYEFLYSVLVGPVTKIIAKKYFNDYSVGLNSAIDVIAANISKYSEKKKAERQIEEISIKIIESIEGSLIDAERLNSSDDNISIEAVSIAVQKILDDHFDLDFIVKNHLKFQSIMEMLKDQIVDKKRLFSSDESYIFDRILEEVIRSIVEVANDLPGFNEKAIAESLLILSNSIEYLEKIIRDIHKISSNVNILVGDRGIEDKLRYERDYKATILRDLDKMELFGAQLSEESRRYKLSVAYISLNTKVKKRNEITNIENLLNKVDGEIRNLVILGHAGTGKSTLFKWICLNVAGNVGMDYSLIAERKLRKDERIKNLLERSKREGFIISDKHYENIKLDFLHWKNRFPFLIRLRDCQDGKIPDIKQFPKYISKYLSDAPEGWIEDILGTGSGLILFDGIDEVSASQRSAFIDDLDTFAKRYPDNIIVLSSRPVAIIREFERRDSLIASIEELTRPDRIQLIEKWHNAISEELSQIGRDDSEIIAIGQRLIIKIDDNPQVARLSSIPLLCAMICALHRERYENLPENRNSLCEAICEMLLTRRDNESRLSLYGFPLIYNNLNYEKKRIVIQDFAFNMFINDKSTIKRDQALKLLEKRLETFLHGVDNVDYDEILDCFIERSGVLREQSFHGDLEFIHNTIKEYLASDRCVDQDLDNLLISRHEDPTGRNVLLFASGSKRIKFVESLIQGLLECQIRSANVMALLCRNTANSLNSNIVQVLKGLEDSLFPLESIEEAEAIATGGDNIIHKLAYRDGMGEKEALLSIRALRLMGTRKALAAIMPYCNDARIHIVQELCLAVNPLYVTVIIKKITNPKTYLEDNVKMQVTDLIPLKRLKKTGYLDLSGLKVRDLSPISHIKDLEILMLSNTHVRDLSVVSKFKNLGMLGASSTRISNLKPLKDCQKLFYLNIDNTDVTDIEPLLDIKSLSTLHLSGSKIINLEILEQMPNLRDLHVYAPPPNFRSIISNIKRNNANVRIQY